MENTTLDTSSQPSLEIKKIEIPTDVTKVEEVKEQKPRKLKKKWLLIPLLILIILVVVIAVPSFLVYKQAKTFYNEVLGVKAAASTKDLKVISEKLTSSKNELQKLEARLNLFIWAKPIPYVADVFHGVKAGQAGLEAGEIMVKAIEPYADLLGLSGGENSGSGEKTAQDRISFIVTTIEKIGPDIDKVGEKLTIAKNEVDQIDPSRYPDEIKGTKVKEPLTQLISVLDDAATLTVEAKPLIKVSPWLLGNDSAKTYLLLFQNDAELRATGGFLTAYALLEVNKGKVKPLLSEDIYALDARFTKRIPAPDPIKKYLKGSSYWFLRDMNLSPDFEESMKTFTENYKLTGSKKFDGIIAVDTKFLVSLLKVIGKIGVPEFGNFSAEPDNRCDGCPNVVYELERMADKPTNVTRTNRKAVLGPLMNSILANAMGATKEKIPGLFEAGFNSLMEKHVLFYFENEEIQSAMESFNLAGRIRDFDGDFFYLVDNSFSGAKANMFIQQSVDQKVEIKDGKVTKTVNVEYRNPSKASNCNLEKGDLCLNADYRNWFRVYVPKGATLLDSSGSEVEIKTYEEFGKTVFEGFFGDKYPLRPEGSAKLSFKYEFPFTAKEYKLLIQKQPGTDGFIYKVTYGRQKQEFELKTDKELKFGI